MNTNEKALARIEKIHEILTCGNLLDILTYIQEITDKSTKNSSAIDRNTTQYEALLNIKKILSSAKLGAFELKISSIIVRNRQALFLYAPMGKKERIPLFTSKNQIRL